MNRCDLCDRETDTRQGGFCDRCMDQLHEARWDEHYAGVGE